MARTALDTLRRQMEAAYRGDPFHALRTNLASVRPDEWDVRPANPSVEEFGTDPVLSIADLVVHVAGGKFMYAARLSGDAALNWTDIAPPSREARDLLAWLDDGHALLEAALGSLGDDAELAVERQAPWRRPLRTEHLISRVVNHDLYHAGEINRQRALIRGARGWERGA